MRVLNLIATLGQGGAERQLSILAPAIAREGIEVAVGFHTGGPNLDALTDSGVKLFPLKSRTNHDPRFALDIVTLIKHYNPTVVQTWLLQMDVLGGLATRWCDTPHILSERSSSAMYAPGGLKLRIRAEIGKRAQAIIANSDGGADYWRKLGARGIMRVIRNVSALSNQQHIPVDDLELSQHPLIVSAGRLSHEKNIPVVVNSLAAALHRLPSHHAVIFGDGPEREDTIARIAELGLSDRLHLGGYTSSLSWWLGRADAFLSASLIEGHPNVVIEAAAAGCPLVLSDIPAHREFADSDSALFAHPLDFNSFAEAIFETVTNRIAASNRVRNAISRVECLSLDRATKQYIDLYQLILKNGNT